MPAPRHHNFGDLFVKFDVKFPEVDPELGLNDAEKLQRRQLLQSVLPPLEARPAPANGEAIDEAHGLEEVQSRQRAKGGATDVDADQDGEMPRGAERVQCATQ